MSAAFKIGDRVICIRDNSWVGGTSKVSKGEIYTVSETFDNGWMRGVNLAEAPLPPGIPRYAASRFRLAALQPQAQPAALSPEGEG